MTIRENAPGNADRSAVGTLPSVGKWHWVSADEQNWFPALHDPRAVGGWTNTDTWEDFEGVIRFWQPIAPPRVLNVLERSRLLVPVDHYASKCVFTRCDGCLNYFRIQHSAWTNVCSPMCAKSRLHRNRASS